MANVSTRVWMEYVKGLDTITERTKQLTLEYIESHDIETNEGRNSLIDYCYGLSTKYGEACAEFACQMYDIISEYEGVYTEPAEPAETATYDETAKTINGVMKTAVTGEIIAAAVSRLVKLSGQDTTLKNAIRDEAYYAWVPVGDTCPYCLMLAAEGWQHASYKSLENGHARHIHSNCNCAYSIRHKETTNYTVYRPEKYKSIYDNAEGQTQEQKLNYIRREAYAENRTKILEQKRSAYQKRKELNDSKAEEINVN